MICTLTKNHISICFSLFLTLKALIIEIIVSHLHLFSFIVSLKMGTSLKLQITKTFPSIMSAMMTTAAVMSIMPMSWDFDSMLGMKLREFVHYVTKTFGITWHFMNKYLQ